MVYRTITGVSLQFYVSRLEHLAKSSTLHWICCGAGSPWTFWSWEWEWANTQAAEFLIVIQDCDDVPSIMQLQ